MPHRAFTLVELLVVIAIMITLMALIMGGVMLAKRSAQRAKAVSLIGAVASAIDQYRSLNNVYPERWKVDSANAAWAAVKVKSAWLDGLADGEEVYDKAFAGGLPSEERVWKGINLQLAWQLGELIREKVDADGFLSDPWKKPLRYRPSKWYPYTAGAAARIDSDQPPGADSYQLWSPGPDEKDAAGNPGEGGDDIPSWSKR